MFLLHLGSPIPMDPHSHGQEVLVFSDALQTLIQHSHVCQQAPCGGKSTRWMLNWTFLLSRMKGCYLSRAKRELRCRGRGRKSSELARHGRDNGINNMPLCLKDITRWKNSLLDSSWHDGSDAGEEGKYFQELKE
ncbi:uncharacterized protein J5F26_003676 isoform 1-T1 [Ciconia maguari]